MSSHSLRRHSGAQAEAAGHTLLLVLLLLMLLLLLQMLLLLLLLQLLLILLLLSFAASHPARTRLALRQSPRLWL
jgi:hypothetical protein